MARFFNHFISFCISFKFLLILQFTGHRNKAVHLKTRLFFYLLSAKYILFFGSTIYLIYCYMNIYIVIYNFVYKNRKYVKGSRHYC